MQYTIKPTQAKRPLNLRFCIYISSYCSAYFSLSTPTYSPLPIPIPIPISPTTRTEQDHHTIHPRRFVTCMHSTSPPSMTLARPK